MKVKIDTKENYVVIRFLDSEITDNMTEEIKNLIQQQQESGKGNLLLDMGTVKLIASKAAKELLGIQQKAYEKDKSFLLCECTSNVMNELSKQQPDNEWIVPTLIEGHDMIQMEIIEREILNAEDQEDID